MAGLRWSFRVGGETLVLAPPAEQGGETTLVVPAIEAAWAIETLSPTTPGRDALVRHDLAMALEAADGSTGRASELPLDELRAAVADAIRAGTLVAFRTTRPMRVQRHLKLEPLGPSESPTSWVEIVLVDDDKEPLAGERYRLETPDGRVIEGTTNASGKAREEGLPPGGTCKISFPDLEPSSWKAA